MPLNVDVECYKEIVSDYTNDLKMFSKDLTKDLMRKDDKRSQNVLNKMTTQLYIVAVLMK